MPLPRKGTPAPTDADDRFDDSRHLRRTLASTGKQASAIWAGVARPLSVADVCFLRKHTSTCRCRVDAGGSRFRPRGSAPVAARRQPANRLRFPTARRAAWWRRSRPRRSHRPALGGGGVAGGGAQVSVPEPRGDLVDRDAGLEQVAGPVGPERVRVREPFGHPGGLALAAHEPVHGDGGGGRGSWSPWRPRRANSGCSSSSPTPRASGWTAVQASSACWTASGRTSRARPALPRRRGGGGERLSAGGAGRGRAGGAARLSAVRSRQGRAAARSRACPRSCAGRAPAGGWRSRCRSGSRAARARDSARGCWRGRAATATTGRGQAPAVGGDHIGVEIADDGRGAELAGEPVPEGAKDCAVLPARARARRPGGDPLRLGEQVVLLESRPDRRRGGG